jgi:N-acetylglucosamine malate deacetylase 1
MQPSVLAIAAHPDDIEFVMAGTLLRLAQVGWQVHYFNIANGCCGSQQLNREECAAIRLQEATRAAAAIPALFYPPICNDLEIFYDHATHARVTAIVRRTRPSIILTHALSDYMEDHQNTARLAVGGAFARGMPNFQCDPPELTYTSDVAVYHAQPHGNRDPLGNPVCPSHVVDVGDLLQRKRELLSYHASQNAWLDASQQMSSYLQSMEDLGRQVAELSGKYTVAEGWRRHLHLGLCAAEFDPLRAALSDSCSIVAPR